MKKLKLHELAIKSFTTKSVNSPNTIVGGVTTDATGPIKIWDVGTKTDHESLLVKPCAEIPRSCHLYAEGCHYILIYMSIVKPGQDPTWD